MSSIKIKYDELEASSKYAKKLAGELDDYSSRITKRISNPVNSLPGNDKRGYASNIASSASAKIRELNNRSNMFDTYASKVQTFVANAEKADKAVQKSIKNTAQSYIGERSKWETFCDNVYNFLFVDCANKYDVVRFLTDAAKSGWTYVTSFTEKARDWFKHGEGKYVWNIVSAVVATVGAIVGAITAVAAAIAGGPVLAVVLAVIAAGAAIVGAIITTVNSAVKVYNNAKALGEDDPGVARYVGGIGSVSDAAEKYDMGDAEDNKKWETAGEVIDTTKTVCDVIGIVKGITDLGAVKSELTGRITGYKFNRNNILTNIRSNLGFDFDKNKFTLEKMFETNFGTGSTKKWYANENGYGGLKFFHNLTTNQQNTIKFVADGSKVVKSVMGLFEKADSIYTNLHNGANFSTPVNTMETIGYTIIDTYSLFGNTTVFSGINDLYSPIEQIMEWAGIKRPERLA